MKERGFKEATLSEASRILGVDKSQLASLSMLLRDKGILEVRELSARRPELTERGREVLERGLPEERLLDLLRNGEASLQEISQNLGQEAGVALGQARRKSLIEISGNRVRLVKSLDETITAIRLAREALELISRGAFPEKTIYEELRSRGLATEREERELFLRLNVDLAEVLERVKVEVSRLNSKMLKSGEWRRYSFRSYDVTAEPPEALPARLHFLRDFIEFLKDIFKEMGFKEISGPIVEYELFNFDLLFQAQDHPAREIHDSLWIRAPGGSLSEYGELVKRVKDVHERSWRYSWKQEIASRLLLRSQTTAVSARIISTRPKPPMRFFTVGRVYRHDTVDATHLPEFHQLDGIEGYEGYSFRELLGTLKDVSERLGLEVKFKPAYFPFTEPSVEGYVRLSGRWLELYGAGMFRPEVLEMAGVDYPVGAWGFGIERLAAAHYGITDIRNLYTSDVDAVRRFRVRL